MLTCTITDTALIFEWPSDTAVKGTATHTYDRNRKFTLTQTQVLVDATISVCSRLSKNSYRSVLAGLRVILEKLTTNCWPAHDNVDDWQHIIITLFEKTIQTKGAKLESRLMYWASTGQILKELARMGVLPRTVNIPNAKNNVRSGEHPSAPIGYKGEQVPPTTEVEGILPKSFLIERDLHKPDDLYLTQFKQELETSISHVAGALKGYWEEMLDTQELGKRLTSSTSAKLCADKIIKNTIDADWTHACADSKPDALECFLILVKHSYETGKIRAISAEEVFRLSTGLAESRIKSLFRMARDICPKKYIQTKFSFEFVGRLIGLLSVIDCNAAIAILIINNPVLTAQSISTAKLYMENGDCYMQVDSEDGLARFSVSKPRSMSRKVAHLNKTSCEVLSKIVECTASTRKLLQKERRSNWASLFIYVSPQGPASNPTEIKNNSRTKNSLKNRLATDLSSIRGNLDLSPSALRATQGIITFLRTGSLVVTSMVLGNSVAVTKSNYIPHWLVNRFGNRTLRILAQKMIVIATHNQPWALAASDFLTTEDLHLFIVRILSEATGNDPFSIIARRRLETGDEATSQKAFKNGDLHLHIDGEVLAALYAYESKVATFSEHEQLRTHPETNLSHQAVCNIARIFRLTAELDVDTASEAEFQVANNFFDESWDKMKAAHEQALSRVEYYNSLFINIRGTTIPQGKPGEI